VARERFEVSRADACSFCAKPRATLVGAVGRTPAICDACLQLCLVIGAPDPEPPLRATPPFSLDDLDPAGRARVKADAERLRRLVAERRAAPTDDVCSFCGASRREVAKLISGPGVFICAPCARDAAAISRTMPA